MRLKILETTCQWNFAPALGRCGYFRRGVRMADAILVGAGQRMKLLGASRVDRRFLHGRFALAADQWGMAFS
jgi:hypothetical protein